MSWEFIGLCILAVTNLAAALITWRTHNKVAHAASDILRVEKATNSMHDALVVATAKAEHAAGVEIGRGESAAVIAAVKETAAAAVAVAQETVIAAKETAVAAKETAVAAKETAVAAKETAITAKEKENPNV